MEYKTFYEEILSKRSCTVDQRAVSNKSGVEVNFVEAENKHYSKINTKKLKSKNSYSVLTVSLMDLLSEYNCPYKFDYLSIDTEGNEFEIIDGPLNTTGGELYYENGVEYIGPYHIHPEKGPMVGAEHIPEPHALLKYGDNLITPADDIETAIPRTPPVADVNYEDFEKLQQAQSMKKRIVKRQSLAKKNIPFKRSSKRSGY